MSDLYISWSDYHRIIEQLAVTIYRSNWEFDQILCLAKGGLRVGDVLARLYDKPLAILSVSSYGGTGGQVRGRVRFAKHITMTTETLGSRILLVDDLVDSGLSLQYTVDWLEEYCQTITDLRTAVLWYKAISVFKPYYYVDYLTDNPWIHQPFERYEKMSPADLSAKWE
ncbi:MAG: phosphoribosyltransferase [Synechococcales bacterium]|jgi:hypoxanthine phosphoribosyltransferase|nr:phosphoribosyltransferase [Cyanobacteria bacterium REEB444]MEB3125633.1 phosphoribosyltransferase [Synechococcales bacterium]